MKEETDSALSSAGPFTHLFYAAYQEHQDQQKQIDVNLSMLRNFVTSGAKASANLERVLLYEGAKYYGAHLGAFPTPAREDDPRVMPPMFYYDQEDWFD